MKQKIKKLIKLKKERVILSDVLPYETPVIFSNRHFYNFLIENKLSIKSNNHFVWESKDKTVNRIINKILNIDNSTDIYEKSITIPFNYRITHKENEYRLLSMIHPKNQVMIIDFYNNYKEMILYYCNISPYSIRKPYKVARYTNHKTNKDKSGQHSGSEYDIVEEFGNSYSNLKSFFTYKKYSNIFKFYESYIYQRCEKKYEKLMKFDISKCFDSIYTHSISWAILNKSIIKENIIKSKKTFAGTFDSLMQLLNHGETNGIVIGPEFSRIFSEIILQKIDLNVYNKLKQDKLYNKKDYDVYRYVDDYFVFYNEESTKDKVLQHFKLELKEFKLYINDTKTKFFNKPIITEITIAKHKISDLFNKHLIFKFDLQESEPSTPSKRENIRYHIYVSSNILISKYKLIIKETGVEYKDLLNYSLAIIERKLFETIRNYQKNVAGLTVPNDKKKLEVKFVKAVIETLDLVFFLCAVAPRVSTTIKLSRILVLIVKYVQTKSDLNEDNKNSIFKKIYDDIIQVFEKHTNNKYTQVETLYLLIILNELGRNYRLDKEKLYDYFNCDIGKMRFHYQLNYWTITTLLFYIKNIARYRELKDIIKKNVLEKYKNKSANIITKDTELTLLTLDLVACPYLEYAFKKDILKLYDINNDNDIKAIINKKNKWFIKWNHFNFEKELNTKKSEEVY